MTEMASHARPGARTAARVPAGRSCSRTSCRTPATASLSFRYATSQVWLVDLVAASDPSLYDLCPEHADALTVPRGWERVDERSPAPEPEPEPEPVVAIPDELARHRMPEGRLAPHSPDHRSSRPPNRYAALSADLPLLAAQVAATGPSAAEHARGGPERAAPASEGDGAGGVAAPPTSSGTSSASSSATSAPPRAAETRPAETRPAESRPVEPRQARSQPHDATFAPPVPTSGPARPTVPSVRDAGDGDDGETGPPPEVDGQLALGVDLFADSLAAAPSGAVVVPIGAGARRRQDRATDSSRLD